MQTRTFIALSCGLTALLTIASKPAAAQPFTLLSQITWGGPDSDIGETVATAPDGSIYVAGRAGSFTTEPGLNVFVLKFTAAGALAWQRTWDIPGTFGDHEPHDLAVGPDGSVYVAGRTPGVGGDAPLLKFDPDGNLIWQRTWGVAGATVPIPPSVRAHIQAQRNGGDAGARNRRRCGNSRRSCRRGGHSSRESYVRRRLRCRSLENPPVRREVLSRERPARVSSGAPERRRSLPGWNVGSGFPLKN